MTVRTLTYVSKLVRSPLDPNPRYKGRCNGANVLIKDESGRRGGSLPCTIKAVRMEPFVEKYSRTDDEIVFVHITYGNSGYELGRIARDWETQTGQKRTVVNLVPKGKMTKAMIRKLEEHSIVIEVDITKEICLNEMRRIVKKTLNREIADDRIIKVDDTEPKNGYQRIVREMREQLEEQNESVPKYLFCPVGDGELAVALAKAAQEEWVGNAPKIIGVTVSGNILAPENENKDFLGHPKESVADKLVCGHSNHKEEIKLLVDKGRLEIITVSDKAIKIEHEFLQMIDMDAEPSAAVAFAGAVGYKLTPEDMVVVVNTGEGIYDKKSAEKRVRKQFRRMIAVAAATTAIALVAIGFAITLYLLYRTEYQRRVYMELVQQRDKQLNYEKEINIINRRIRYTTIAEVAADKNRNFNVDDDEAHELCQRVYGGGSENAAKRCTGISWPRLTSKEKRYYGMLVELDINADSFTWRIYDRLRSEWDTGTFE
ncbi:MAG: pyridoxal-phosphate dependent enzyme [Candidatus Micrarchaeota archaeon]|nr:PLP-dependent lyase/thiolase [Candidatus Micrarchaeota archaeon]MBU1886300.1 PLP-dependent lyase/thiolase [Candidatus Micrarchaeota archaeon]